MPNITIPKKTGYTFDGYFSEPDGQGTQYYDQNGQPLRNWDNVNDVSAQGSTSYTTSTATLYAKWTLNTYNVDYITHGGKFKNDVISHRASDLDLSRKGRSKKISTYSVESEDIVLETPERKGAEFKGWKRK